LQTPDSGEVSRQARTGRQLSAAGFHARCGEERAENIRDGAKHVLDLIAEFESLPHDSKRHEELEHRIAALEGWTLDRRIETAMSHLNCPAGDRRIESLPAARSGAWRCAARLFRSPDF
jgi:ABC transport system ATP-binding/permease protein